MRGCLAVGKASSWEPRMHTHSSSASKASHARAEQHLHLAAHFAFLAILFPPQLRQVAAEPRSGLMCASSVPCGGSEESSPSRLAAAATKDGTWASLAASRRFTLMHTEVAN